MEKDRNKGALKARRNFARSHNKRVDRLSNSQSGGVQAFVLPGIEDDKIKLLFEEIRAAEAHKRQAMVSDDEMSEGSSDQEDEAEDLTPSKLKFLYQIIKNRKRNNKNSDELHCQFVGEQRSEVSPEQPDLEETKSMGQSSEDCEED